MMEMKGHSRKLFEKALTRAMRAERLWWKSDRRGRWVVLEPCLSHVGAAVFIERRGRRFSSRACARAFAREVGGEVRHWRRQMSAREGNTKLKVTWRYEANLWARVWRHSGLWLWCPPGKDEPLP